MLTEGSNQHIRPTCCWRVRFCDSHGLRMLHTYRYFRQIIIAWIVRVQATGVSPVVPILSEARGVHQVLTRFLAIFSSMVGLFQWLNIVSTSGRWELFRNTTKEINSWSLIFVVSKYCQDVWWFCESESNDHKMNHFWQLLKFSWHYCTSPHCPYPSPIKQLRPIQVQNHCMCHTATLGGPGTHPPWGCHHCIGGLFPALRRLSQPNSLIAAQEQWGGLPTHERETCPSEVSTTARCPEHTCLHPLSSPTSFLLQAASTWSSSAASSDAACVWCWYWWHPPHHRDLNHRHLNCQCSWKKWPHNQLRVFYSGALPWTGWRGQSRCGPRLMTLPGGWCLHLIQYLWSFDGWKGNVCPVGICLTHAVTT